MWLDALALLILGVFIGIGALRGALASGLALATLGVAYGAAILAAPRLGPGLAEAADIAEPMGLAFAGMGAFLAGFVAMGILTKVLTRIERRRGEEARSARDRFMGGVFGALRGGLVVILIAWGALWVEALRATGTAPDLPELGSSTAATLTGELIEAGVETAMQDSGASGRLVARMAGHPAATLTDLQGLVESPQLEGLRTDTMFWTYVESGAVDAAMNRGSFLRISRDPVMRGRLADLGLIEQEVADDPRRFRAAAGDVLREVGPRLRRVKNDPELHRLVEDPEIQTALQSGNTFALVTHPAFRQLVSRVLADEG